MNGGGPTRSAAVPIAVLSLPLAACDTVDVSVTSGRQ